MTTSGSTSNNPVRDVIVKKALRLCGAYATGSNPRPDQITDAVEALNMMLKAWQIQGFMWVRDYVTLFLVPGQAAYALPGANGARTVVSTTLDGALAALDTVVQVASTAGMSAADVVGVYLASGALHWDVIASVDSATQITLTTGVVGAADDGAAVYAYDPADALYRPTRVFNVQRKARLGNEVSLSSMARDDYSQQVNKETRATPVQFYFDPQTSAGKLYLWPTPLNASEILILDIDRPIQVMLTSSNTFDFPEEWIECIANGLAVRIAPEYAVPLAERRELKSEFASMANNLLNYNIDWTSTFLGVDNG
jgi:hypothetical protein